MPDPAAPKKKIDTKSPIFIGICIVIVVGIIIILYYVYTSMSRGSKAATHGSTDIASRGPMESKDMPKLNIKLITNDYEINNLINKINKST